MVMIDVTLSLSKGHKRKQSKNYPLVTLISKSVGGVAYVDT